MSLTEEQGYELIKALTGAYNVDNLSVDELPLVQIGNALSNAEQRQNISSASKAILYGLMGSDTLTDDPDLLPLPRIAAALERIANALENLI